MATTTSSSLSAFLRNSLMCEPVNPGAPLLLLNGIALE